MWFARYSHGTQPWQPTAESGSIRVKGRRKRRPHGLHCGGACPPYGPGRAATMEPMRFRVQQLDNRENRFVLCVQPSASDPWRCRIVRARQLQQILDWLGFEDYRDAYEIYRQTRAAVREFGLGAGYIEYDLDREQDRGPIRFQGTLRPGYHWPPGEDAGAQ